MQFNLIVDIIFWFGVLNWLGRLFPHLWQLWGHKVGNIPPSFVLGLRPMPRLIITYEEGNGDHGNPKNCAEDKVPRLKQKKSDLPTNAVSQSLPRKKISTTYKSTLEHGSRAILGKSCYLPIKYSTTNTLTTLM